MSQSARSALTLSVLALLLVGAALWGWSAATAPLPGKVDTPICEQRAISAGDKIFPQDVTVSVYNAGTREGLAGRVMESFMTAGFARGSDGNATGAKVATAQIWTTEPSNPAVALVASKLGSNVDIQRRKGIGPGVNVVVGDGYSKLEKGVRAVTAENDAQICSPPVE